MDKKSRAVWNRDEEKLLMQSYFTARNDASLKSDKGIKSKGWGQIIAQLSKEGMVVDKDQCTKYSRLMAEYDVFKRVCDLSGAGWSAAENKPTLDDDGWKALCDAHPRHIALYKRFKREGFVHSEICALVAGDSRATAEEASDITMLVAGECRALLRGLPEDDEIATNSPQTPSAVEEEDPSDAASFIQNTTPRASSTSALHPPSADKRLERVKRFRDGRKKSTKKSISEETDASINAFMKTADRYLELKTRQLEQSLAASAAQAPPDP